MSEPERRLRGRRGRRLRPVSCGLLGALLFAPAVGSGRLADDFVLLRTVRQSTGVLWPFLHNDLGQPAGSGHFYRPVWVIWNAAVYQVSHNPLVAHLLNLILFGVACAEVVLLLTRVVDGRAALAGGLLFAAFPSHGESVAWVSGSTDLLAAVLGLAAILVALRRTATITRDLSVAGLTALAMLTKEIGVVLPVLAAILLWAQAASESGGSRSLSYWRPVLAMVTAVAIVLAARSFIVFGIGGYGGNPLTAKRAAGSLVSFSVAGLSVPQLPVLRHPLLLLVPVGLLALISWGAYRAWRAADKRSVTAALVGALWFLVALVPVLNQPLNLNTRNGDRLLLLPSVGLALLAGALIARTPGRRATLVCGALVAIGAVSCVSDAIDWNTAGHESRRILADIDRLAPRNARIIALSVPTDYRAAHLYPDALDIAVQESGRPDVTLTACVPVHVLTLRSDQASFHAVPGGSWVGLSTPAAPFDIPVLAGSQTGAANRCAFGNAPGAAGTGLGTSLGATVRPTIPSGQSAHLVYYDGRDMRPQPR